MLTQLVEVGVVGGVGVAVDDIVTVSELVVVKVFGGEATYFGVHALLDGQHVGLHVVEDHALEETAVLAQLLGALAKHGRRQLLVVADHDQLGGLVPQRNQHAELGGLAALVRYHLVETSLGVLEPVAARRGQRARDDFGLRQQIIRYFVFLAFV